MTRGCQSAPVPLPGDCRTPGADAAHRGAPRSPQAGTPRRTCPCSRASRRCASAPGMYIGSTDSRGLMHCLWEILDNSVDEALGGWCTRIDMILRADGSVEVHDDGRGIPVDVEPRTRLTGVEVVMTKLHAGGKFGGGSYTASGGLHGVGASVVNALSSRLDVEVDRDARIHLISFRRGVPGLFDGEGPDAEFTKKSGPAPGGLLPAGEDRHPGAVLAGHADLHRRRRDRPRAGARPRPADDLPRPRADDRRARRARPGGPRRAHVRPPGRDRRVRRAPVDRRGGVAGAAPGRVRELHRDGAGPGQARSHGAHRGRARARRRRRAAVGQPLRHRGALVRQHRGHPQGRHARGRLRAGPGQDAQRLRSPPRRSSSPARARSPRRTPSRGRPR